MSGLTAHIAINLQGMNDLLLVPFKLKILLKILVKQEYDQLFSWTAVLNT